MDVNWDEREISAAEGVPRCIGAARCVSSSSVLHLIKRERTAPGISVKSGVSPRCLRSELYNSTDVDELPRCLGLDQTLQPFLPSEI